MPLREQAVRTVPVLALGQRDLSGGPRLLGQGSLAPGALGNSRTWEKGSAEHSVKVAAAWAHVTDEETEPREHLHGAQGVVKGDTHFLHLVPA